MFPFFGTIDNFLMEKTQRMCDALYIGTDYSVTKFTLSRWLYMTALILLWLVTIASGDSLVAMAIFANSLIVCCILLPVINMAEENVKHGFCDLTHEPKGVRLLALFMFSGVIIFFLVAWWQSHGETLSVIYEFAVYIFLCFIALSYVSGTTWTPVTIQKQTDLFNSANN